MKKIYYIVIIFFICSCKTDYTKNVEYGSVVFLAQDDGLITFDELVLYDNNLFKVDVSGLKANGEYKIQEDTILLKYYLYDKSDFTKFLKKKRTYI